MHQLQQRYLQYLAAQRFHKGESEDFAEEELREEAAFRCWLREIDPQDHPELPSSNTLHTMANSYDWEHGEFIWWSWPVWSTCALCQLREAQLCAQCESYMRYCSLSEGWTTAFEDDALFPTAE